MIKPVTKANSGSLTLFRKQWVKARIRGVEQRLRRVFWSYDPDRFRSALAEIGISIGDAILVHSAFKANNGFVGTPKDVVDVLRESVGTSGTLAMPSMPYTTSTKQYLASGNVLHVQRTPSHMGIITETFRRSGASRSLSPTHPILACGAQAEWLLAGHQKCQYPCGPGSPLERLLQIDAKLLFFDVPFLPYTFLHYMEHQLQEYLPFDLYDRTPVEAKFIDEEGRIGTCDVFVFSDEATRRRRAEVISDTMRDEGRVFFSRVGNSKLILAHMKDMWDTARRLAQSGSLPFDLSR